MKIDFPIHPFASFVLSTFLSLGGCAASSAAVTTPTEDHSGAQSEEQRCIAAAGIDAELPSDAPAAVEVSQILVRHAELERASGVARSRGEACLRAEAALMALQTSGDWDATFEEFSDAGGATMGALGKIRPEEVVGAFAAIAFALEVNQIGPVVETERGFHVILRTR